MPEPGMRVVLIQIDARLADGTIVPVRVSNANDPAGCHLDGLQWDPALSQAPLLRYDFFGGAFQNPIPLPQAQFALSLSALAQVSVNLMAALRFAGARVRIWTGPLGEYWSSYRLRFDGRVEAEPEIASFLATFSAKPDDAWLDVPLLDTYAGTGGIEGPEDLTGTVKPLVMGSARFVPGVLIDPVDNVYQVSAYGPVQAILAVYDRLAALGAGADHADLAALLAADIAPGDYGTCLAFGLIRLGAPADGKVSIDIEGDAAGATGYVDRAGAFIARLAELGGGVTAAGNIAALDLARPWEQCRVLQEQGTARQFIQELVDSVAAVAGISWAGVFYVQPYGFGDPVITLDARGISEPLVAEVTQQPVATPFWRLATYAAITWSVHSADEIATGYTLRGLYSADRTYRLDDLVTDSGGSTWLYIYTTPTAGSALPTPPDTSNTWWQQLSTGTAEWSAITGTGKPEDNATVGAPSGTDVGGRDADAVAGAINADGTIADNKVITDSIADNAVSDNSGAFTSGTTSLGSSYSNVQSLTVTTDGEQVMLFYSLAWEYLTDNAKGDCALYRDSTPLVVLGQITINSGESPTTAGVFIDAPAAGTYTYYLKAKTNDPGDIGASNRSILQLGLKK
jgi:hypothetical protein